jgi:Zinc finger, C3HC4 type (RING finger)
MEELNITYSPSEPPSEYPSELRANLQVNPSEPPSEYPSEPPSELPNDNLNDSVDANVVEEPEKCPVCQEFTVLTVGFTSCLHIMCGGCLSQLSERHRRNIPCPLCRVPIDGISPKPDIDEQVKNIIGQQEYANRIIEQNVDIADNINNRNASQRERDNIFGDNMFDIPFPATNGPIPPRAIPNTDITSLSFWLPIITTQVPILSQGIRDFMNTRRRVFNIGQPIRYIAMFFQMLAFCFICAASLIPDSNKTITVCFIVLFGAGHIMREAVYDISLRFERPI